MRLLRVKLMVSYETLKFNLIKKNPLGVQKSGDECLESLKKFGKIVGYIISGVIISIICCCCLCWCCICKAIYSNKRGGQNGQVLHHNNPIQHPYGTNAVENPAITTVA